eukprot:NODE_5873_length_548_cov_176.862069.p3 GENE.NODE_5873_length_548_cov_176.862069~~NODE_5873_length_548_cov_176.862069.p3  ORF type:complete len:104 (+),score=25.95 NODE_5873_length_548_cov_176.862069:3-314(+)
MGGELTAISQYDDQLRYDFVVEHAEVAVAVIRQCFEQVKPLLAQLGYVMAVVDFVVLPECGDASGGGGGGSGSDAWRARVVEINPFGSRRWCLADGPQPAACR